MSRREFITLVEGTILRRRLAATFLAGVLSIALHATGYSGESKKPNVPPVIEYLHSPVMVDNREGTISVAAAVLALYEFLPIRGVGAISICSGCPFINAAHA